MNLCTLTGCSAVDLQWLQNDRYPCKEKTYVPFCTVMIESERKASLVDLQIAHVRQDRYLTRYFIHVRDLEMYFDLKFYLDQYCNIEFTYKYKIQIFLRKLP